jgi:opacity protein-like surface antigen
VHYGNYGGYNPGTGTWSSLSSLDSVFAYQVLAGFKLNLSQSVALDLAYNWFVLSDPSLQEPPSAGYVNFKSSYRTNSFVLGLDWTF